jgi:hypothetical protein
MKWSHSFMVLFGAMLLLFGCRVLAHGDELEVAEITEARVLPSSGTCTVQAVRYPTTAADFSALYRGRGFYTDGNHLGRDLVIAEGVPIFPIACGTVQVYRSAVGYGSLVAVVEHELPYPVVVENGVGASVSVTRFLSIYGHVRRTPEANGNAPLPYSVGSQVTANDVLGYIQNAAHNGDGEEHLHLGIRLQSASEAANVDRNWFRGYDSEDPSQRRWYADPATFLRTLMQRGIVVRWHPPGTVVERAANGTHWLLGAGSAPFALPLGIEVAEHLSGHVISVTEAEFGCLGPSPGSVVPTLASHELLKFDDSSTVYERDPTKHERWTFLNESTFFSWGWDFAQVKTWPANTRSSWLNGSVDRGFRTMRDGALVKSAAVSEVSVMSEYRRMPIYDWDTFLALGYKDANIVSLDPNVFDASTGPRGDLITPELVSLCRHPETCLVNCPKLGFGGGGVEYVDDGSAGAGDTPTVDVVDAGTADVPLRDASVFLDDAGHMTPDAGTADVVQAHDAESHEDAESLDAGGEPVSAVDASAPDTDAGLMDTAVDHAAVDAGVGDAVPEASFCAPLHFHYASPLQGSLHVEGWWIPPTGPYQSWHALQECADMNTADAVLDCDLSVPCGSRHFEFQVYLPGNRYWGDHACDSGGCGAPLGVVTLTHEGTNVSYTFTPNPWGPPYYNGLLDLVP